MNGSQAIAESIRNGRVKLQRDLLEALDEEAGRAVAFAEIRAAQELGRQPSLLPSRQGDSGRGAGDLLAG